MIGKKKVLPGFMIAGLLLAGTAPARSETFTWIGSGETGNWSDEANWSFTGNPDPRYPTSDDDVIHDGSGAGIILVNIPDAECKTFTATAGGSPLRSLRILPNMKLTVGIPNNPPPGNRLSFRVLGQTEQVRYLTELKEFGEFHTQMGDGIDGGDYLLLPHSFMNYNGSPTRLRGGVWTLRGGRFYSTESEGGGFGEAGDGGKAIVEKGGAFMLVHAPVYMDEIEVQPGGVFYAGDVHPQVKVTNTGGMVRTAAPSELVRQYRELGPTAPPPLPYAIPDALMTPQQQAAFILANFDREQINLWISVLGDRASRAATPQQRAELEELARLLANGVAQ